MECRVGDRAMALSFRVHSHCVRRSKLSTQSKQSFLFGAMAPRRFRKTTLPEIWGRPVVKHGTVGAITKSKIRLARRPRVHWSGLCYLDDDSDSRLIEEVARACTGSMDIRSAFATVVLRRKFPDAVCRIVGSFLDRGTRPLHVSTLEWCEDVSCQLLIDVLLWGRVLYPRPYPSF